MKQLSIAIMVIWLSYAAFAQKNDGAPSSDRAACVAQAKRSLGAGAQVVKFGSLTGDNGIECLAVVPYRNRDGRVMLIRRGAIFHIRGSQWVSVLTIDANVRNDHGYIGIDFLDRSYTSGFAISTADERSDGTKGFTLYLTYLGPQLRREGLPIQVAWNAKVHRFQEYAPNELDPPDFKPEVANPPVKR